MTHADMIDIVDCIVRDGDVKGVMELCDLDISREGIEAFLEKLADYLEDQIGGGVFDDD